MRGAVFAAIALASSAARAEGGSREITCFSGGVPIYHGWSDPSAPVYLGSADNHVIFRDLSTGRQMRVGGDCVVSWDLARR